MKRTNFESDWTNKETWLVNKEYTMHLSYGGYEVSKAAECLKIFCYGTVRNEYFPRIADTVEGALQMLENVNWQEIAEANIKRSMLAEKRAIAYDAKVKHKHLAKLAMR
jgi:hypothetical protein